jgi:hypothetical protein
MDWPGGSWQDTVRIIAAGAIVYFIVLWVGLVIWVYRDIRERTRDIFHQTVSVLLALFFNLAGLLVYLLIRPQETLAQVYQRSLEEEALLQDLEEISACPNCRHPVESEFVICPLCRTQIKEPCINCGKPLSYSWIACPYCSTNRPVIATSIAAQERKEAIQPEEPEPAQPARRRRSAAESTTATATEEVVAMDPPAAPSVEKSY